MLSFYRSVTRINPAAYRPVICICAVCDTSQTTVRPMLLSAPPYFPDQTPNLSLRETQREVLSALSQKGLSRVGHERPLNTNSCANQPAKMRSILESSHIEEINHIDVILVGMTRHVALN